LEWSRKVPCLLAKHKGEWPNQIKILLPKINLEVGFLTKLTAVKEKRISRTKPSDLLIIQEQISRLQASQNLTK
jgi:hypothetical protein